MAVPPISRLLHQRNVLLSEVDRLRVELEREQHERHQPASQPNGITGYSDATPAHQNAFDVFPAEWSSAVPGFQTGARADLFGDTRIAWLERKCGGFTNKRILELGPLEAGHTFMMERGGASHITAIEGNKRAFLKCLVVKNALGLSAQFLLGDFRQYVRECTHRYDFVLASGVLYHMLEPTELLEGLARISDSLGIWTHYFDASVVASRPDLARKFSTTPRVRPLSGRSVSLYEQRYLEALNWSGFCGGSAPTSAWMTKPDIIGVLTDLGFTAEIGNEEPAHPNGPSMLVFAKRNSVP